MMYPAYPRKDRRQALKGPSALFLSNLVLWSPHAHYPR